jgi:hypothetical protein
VDSNDEVFEQLFLTPIDGGEPELVTLGDRWMNPKCSPDGEWILCTMYRESASADVTLLKAFHLSERKAYNIFLNQTEMANMGDWAPSGRQFCYTLSGTSSANGESIRKSTIHIRDFSLGDIGQVKTGIAAQPLSFRLIGNYPNPFNLSTTIQYSLPSAGLTELVIYNITGQKVCELINGRMESGKHSVEWAGRDQRGKPVSSGVYISRLKMEGKVETRRMTLVK